MNELQVFKNEIFGEIRTISVDGEPWFIGNDVAKALGYSNTRDAIAVHVDEDDKNTVAIHDGIPGNPNQTVINESGVYSLIFGSQLESAKAFKHWVTHDVLPTIRKQGYYSAYDTEEELIAAIVRNVEDENKLTTIIKALRLANIDQGLFMAQLTGMTANEYGRCKALLDRSDRNDVAKRRMKRWEHYGQRIYTRDDLPEKYREGVYIGSLIEELSKKHENGDFFVNYCGKIYFNAYGYRAILKKLLRNKLITEDEKLAIEREADVL